MERSYFKYIFVVVIFILVIFTTYQFVKEKNTINNTDLDQTSTLSTIQTDLRFAIAEMDNINPIISKNRNVQEITKIIYEPLISLDENYKLEYCLAEEIAKQDDTTYLVKLRQNVKWHDGTEFTSEDVKFTFDSIKQGIVSSIYASNLNYVNGLEIIDKYTLKIFLSQEVPFFEYYLTVPMMSSNYYAGTDLNNADKNIAPIGTGIFRISMINGNVITLTKNEGYWNLERVPMAKEIIITNYQSIGEVYNAFKSGDIDLITVTTNNIEEYIGTIGYNKIEYKTRNYDFISFNNNSKIFSDSAVRKAISVAIDKNSVVASLGVGYTVSNFSLDMGSWLYTKDINVANDVDRAKQILLENGWNYKNNTWQKNINGEKVKLEFTITVNEENAERIKAAENIANQLYNLGIAVDVKKVSSDNYINILNGADYECVITGLEVGFSPSVETFFADGNLAKYNNDEIKQIIIEARNTKDNAKMHSLYERIYEIYLEEAPYVGLYRTTDLIICNQGLVGNITANSYNIYHNIEKWYRQ